MYQNSPEHIVNIMAAREKSFAAMAALKQKRIEAYESSPNHCKQCSSALPYEKRTNQFCTMSCRTKHSNLVRSRTGNFHSAETKARIAAAVKAAQLAQALTERQGWNCAYCGAEFLPAKKRNRAKYCSPTCGRKALSDIRASEPYRQNMAEKGRANIEVQMASGSWTGWPVRNGPSFAEQFVCAEFTRLGFSFVTEFQVNRYSIDIAFPDLMIAIEVDGRQHETPEHKAHDEARDTFLVALGWRVLRIKWSSIKRESGRAAVMRQISEVVATLQSVSAAKT